MRKVGRALCWLVIISYSEASLHELGGSLGFWAIPDPYAHWEMAWLQAAGALGAFGYFKWMKWL